MQSPSLAAASCGLFLFCFFGAGCTPSPTTGVAQPFPTEQAFATVNPKNGFGALPEIKTFPSQATITLAQPLPPLPATVTVLRLKPGTPTGVELDNLAAAISVPAGIIGNQPLTRQLTIDWTNEQGIHWTYNAAERDLSFTLNSAPTQPLTVTSLPTNDSIIRIANDFLTTHGLSLQDYQDGGVEPDWIDWWLISKQAGLCMDAPARDALRASAAKPNQLSTRLPTLHSSSEVTCVTPEFPSHVVVRYHDFADQQDVVGTDGSGISGISLVVDAIHQTVVGGDITLTMDPDRSDYPVLSSAQVQQSLLSGGVSDVSGAITITNYQTVFLQFQDQTIPDGPIYLIPSLLASGSRAGADGSTTTAQIVVPLVGQM